MPIEQIENRRSVQEEFLVSEKYAALKKEVAESMASVDVLETGESDGDIAPSFDYFEKHLTGEGFMEGQAEKLFWQAVAENLNRDFQDIYYLVRPDIEKREYNSARQILVQELNKIIEKLSHTLYGNLSRKSVALMVLKEEFYKMFPEFEGINKEEEGGKKEQDDEKWKREKGEYLVEYVIWNVPDGKQLIPGLKIALEDIEAKRMENIEFLEYPHLEEGELFVKVKWNGAEGNIKLADFGLAADAETGLWNSRYKPLLWELDGKSYYP